jgi:hypothetical protein
MMIIARGGRGGYESHALPSKIISGITCIIFAFDKESNDIFVFLCEIAIIAWMAMKCMGTINCLEKSWGALNAANFFP